MPRTSRKPKSEKGDGRVRRGAGREALCAALVRVVARSGLDGVTYRSVAAEAGVSHGSASYHFATRDEMIHEALLWATRHSLQVSRIANYRTLDEFAGNLVELMSEYPEESVFSFQLVLEAARRPELVSDVRASYYEAIESVRTALEHLGLGDDLPLARVVFAAIDGLSIQHLIYRDSNATEEGVKVIQDLLGVLISERQAAPSAQEHTEASA